MAKLRVVSTDRIKTLEASYIARPGTPASHIRGELVRQMAAELIAKMFEHHKVRTEETPMGTEYIASLDIIVPEKGEVS